MIPNIGWMNAYAPVFYAKIEPAAMCAALR
jgi:hypothetical protein